VLRLQGEFQTGKIKYINIKAKKRRNDAKTVMTISAFLPSEEPYSEEKTGIRDSLSSCQTTILSQKFQTETSNTMRHDIP